MAKAKAGTSLVHNALLKLKLGIVMGRIDNDVIYIIDA